MSSLDYPRYDTKLFTEVYDNVTDFKTEFQASPFAGAIHYGETAGGVTYPDNVSLLYYLLYARFANTPIANFDENQWKYRLFSTIWQYGPTWEKRLDIQDKLRDLSDDDLMAGSKTIYNHAYNPGTDPSTAELEELEYINDQNTTNYKRGKLEAYSTVWDLLKVDVTQNFINRFKELFKTFVTPERIAIYATNEEDD